MKNKHANFKLYALFITVAVIVAVILINTIAGALLAWHPVKIDLTKSQVYTLSDRTKDTVKSLSDPVTAYVLFSEETEETYYHVRDVMDEYGALSDKLTVSYLDPYADYEFVKNYTEKGLTLSDGTIILECGEKLRTLSVSQFYTEEYGSFFDLERMLTAALIRITGEEGGKVYLISNHGEYTDSFAEYLDMNLVDYALLDLNNLATNGRLIPSDAEAIVVIAPQYDYSELELALIDGYLEKDGKAIFSFLYEYGEMPYLYTYLENAWGMKIDHQIIVEGNSSYRIQTPNGEQMNTAKMVSHETTSSLIQADLTYVAPLAMPVLSTSENAYFATMTPLIKTSSSSYTSAKSVGPYTVAALSETTNGKNAKVLYLGSAYTLIDPTINTATNLANGDFILNAIDYMTDNTSSMDIRSKNVALSTMSMTQTSVNIVYYVLKLAIPALIILCGVVIWLKRRYK